ncbi:hypothetical protein VTN49DRAFT_774 [Thermomyces lanuginosus]|uniref:uncharacterized protein n=1 Tax=Thermomyces lanuginosus TaxID=5541 RepID=UPI0037440C29
MSVRNRRTSLPMEPARTRHKNNIHGNLFPNSKYAFAKKTPTGTIWPPQNTGTRITQKTLWNTRMPSAICKINAAYVITAKRQ